MPTLFILATEGGIPASSPWAKLAVPIGILVFVGATYMLVRSNLGTRRGYLVLGTSLWGFMTVYALFWTFGAPGTPPTTGPQNLPGQEADAYLPVWRPFAPDSAIAADPTYDVVQSFPDGFEPVPEDMAQLVTEGIAEIQQFFSSEELNPKPIQATWEPAGEPLYAVADNGRPVIGVTFQETFQISSSGEQPAGPVGEIDPEGDSYTAFAFFDAGSPLFPSLVMLGLVFVLFVLHALLLARDERRERVELGEDVAAEEERPVRV